MKVSWIERQMFRPLPVWLVSVLIIFALLGMVAFGNIAIHAYKGGTKAGVLGDIVLTASTLPEFVKGLQAQKDYLQIAGDPHPGKSGFSFRAPAGTRPDAGYLLLSRFDGGQNRGVIEFWDLNDQTLVHTWLPPIDDINAASVDFHSQEIDLMKDRTQDRTLIRHPVVTDDGSLLIKNWSPLTKVDACSQVTWINDDHLFHHAMEPDADGAIWTASRYDPPSVPLVRKGTFLDDAITRVSPQGSVILKRSVTALMSDQGLASLIYSGPFYSDDLIHLNDVQPVVEDGPFWRAGDVFLSLRNSSLLMLYRPSTDRIVWYKQGPWSHQHDVDILDDHRISVFDNHSFPTYGGNKVDPFGDLDGHSDIAVYDFETDTVSYPWSKAMAVLDLTSATEGLHTVRPNGNLFVEEQNRARLVEIDADGQVLWDYVNRAGDGVLYRTGWSRIIEPDRGKRIATALAKAACP